MEDLYKNKYRLASTRLSSWDYGSNGAYFVTICTDHKTPYFGNIENSILSKTLIGDYACRCWDAIPEHYPFVKLDAFVLMPDHLHGIVCFEKSNLKKETNQFGRQSQNLGSVIRSFKGAVKFYANSNLIQFHWQSRFYDRIIRNENELDQIRKYIFENPTTWINAHP